ncbi:hypothetical protein HYU23_03295 [Candidatus Woesearchaeota archaeon]|nr:hypothetical protein [Candidatus Woesearchaeota archaeon]
MKKSTMFKAFFEIFLIVSLAFVFSISNSLLASSAPQDNRVCCQKTKTGNYCQYTSKDNCDTKSGIFGGSCESVGVCKPVCCNLNKLGYYGSSGQGCYKNVPLNTCVNDLKGEVISDSSCNVQECSKGCCAIGTQCGLMTEQNCKDLTGNYPNLELKYNPDVKEEVECLNVCRSNTRGCCILKESQTNNNCKSTTFSQCSADGGQFYENSSCDGLPQGINDCNNCKYKDTEKKKLGCAPILDGGEDVYEFDKCGNPTRIATVAGDGKSGDCSYSNGNLCTEENSTAFCKSLNCISSSLWDNPTVDENGDGVYDNDNSSGVLFHGNPFRINGESWCEYDADAGPGRDLPGTRHYIHTCYNGKEIVDECRDYREEFCVQFKGISMDQAACVTNKAAKESCSVCNNDEACCKGKFSGSCLWLPSGPPKPVDDQRIYSEQCEINKKNSKNPDEYVCPNKPEVPPPGPQDNKGTCLPLVPPGTKNNEGVCTPGDIEIKTFWLTYGWGSNYHCEAGCDSYTKLAAYDQNNLCKSLGDCGANFNLAGGWSNLGFSRECEVKDIAITYNAVLTGEVKGIDFIDADGVDYAKGSKAVELVNQCSISLKDPGSYKKQDDIKVLPDDFYELSRYKNLLKIELPKDAIFDNSFMEDSVKALYGIGITIGASAIIGILAISLATGASITAVLATGAAVGATATAVAAGAAGAAAGTAAGASAAAAATTASTVATSVTTGLVASASASASTIWGLIVAAVLIIIAVVFSTTMKTSEQKIIIDCSPWQPPLGSKNCNLCNEPGYREYLANGEKKKEYVDLTAGGLHHCTPYLCWSLGQGCKYTQTNEGPKCLAEKCTVNSPKRSPLTNLDKLNPGVCTSNNGPNGPEASCSAVKEVADVGHGGYNINFVKANTDIIVGIQTDKLAICRWDWERKSKYDDLKKGFSQAEASKVHTVKLEADKDLLPGDKKTMHVLCKDTCGNPQGASPTYTIDLEVAKMQDLGAPIFVSIEPKDGSAVKYNSDVTSVNLKLNEKAECRWSKTNDPYITMKDTFSCTTPTKGCDMILTDIQEGLNIFYIRCQDKQNNTNIDPLPSNNGYKITRSKPLNISSVKCLNSFDDKCGTIYDSNFTLQVTTINGAENGKAVCSALSSTLEWYEFFNTNSSVSTQVIGPRITGNYIEYIKCIDIAGNEAKSQANFNMIRDDNPPKILKVSLDSGTLNVLTDEISVCRHSDDSNFIFSNMTEFDSTNNVKHSTKFTNIDYINVKCSDRFNHIINFNIYSSGNVVQ